MRAGIPLFVTAALLGGQVALAAPASADLRGPRVTAVLHKAAVKSPVRKDQRQVVRKGKGDVARKGKRQVTSKGKGFVVRKGKRDVVRSRLRIAIEGAPKGRVRVKGPRTDRTVRTDVTLRVPVGTYRVRAVAVTASGDDYAPTRRSWRVGVRRGALTMVNATYERSGAAAGGRIDEQTGPSGEMAVLFDLVNRARATGHKCGARNMPAVDPLLWDDDLARAASLHAEDMADRKYFDHDTPDGRSFVDRIEATAYDGYAAGENIAMGFQSAEAVMAGWLDSPGHCVNVMDPDFVHVGLGFASRSEAGYTLPTTYWVQDFGYAP